MPTPVEEIRRAAQLIRERTKAASAPPWQALHGNSWAGDHVVADIEGHPLLATGDAEEAAGDVDHAASWHPGVALAVADWLDFIGDQVDQGRPWILMANAQRVAQTYLGNTP